MGLAAVHYLNAMCADPAWDRDRDQLAILRVLADVCRDHRDGEPIWPSLDTIQERTRIRRSRIGAVIRELEELGDIAVERAGTGGGRSRNRYRVFPAAVVVPDAEPQAATRSSSRSRRSSSQTARSGSACGTGTREQEQPLTPPVVGTPVVNDEPQALARRGRRSDGTNPRALRTNPRALSVPASSHQLTVICPVCLGLAGRSCECENQDSAPIVANPASLVASLRSSLRPALPGHSGPEDQEIAPQRSTGT